jgi:N-methylhydantoinase B
MPDVHSLSEVDASAARSRYGSSLIELETVRYGLIEIARDMHQALLRGAFSPAVRDIMDCTTCIHMRTDAGWEMVASWEGCTQHAFTSQHICNFVMSEWDDTILQDGDVILVNDPWRGAIHQSDLNLLRPVRINGNIEFVLHSTSHVMDLGGPVAGGFAMAAQTVFEEPLKFPPVLLYANDVPVRSVFNQLLENVRLPASVLGDVRALYGCLVIGERRLRDVIERHSFDQVRAAASYGMDVTEASLRSAIAAVPDGDYRAEDFLDDDGVGAEPLQLVTTLRVRGDSMEVDYSGSARQPLGSAGTAWIESTRCIIGIKFLLDPLPPVNSGTLRPIEAILPPGSAVCSLPPSSCSNHVDIGFRVVNMTTQALSQAIPEHAIGCDTGAGGMLIVGGIDDRAGHEGNPWGAFAVPAGGWGGTWETDGVTLCASSIGDIRSAVHEHVERESPVIVWQHEIMPDSAGAGQHRGGFGGVYTMQALSDTIVTVGTDRLRTGAPGVMGGGPGMPGFAWVIPAFDPSESLDVLDLRHAKPLCGMFDADGRPDPEGRTVGLQSGKFSAFVLHPGDGLRIMLGGGGGWGDPLLRLTELVLGDVLNGLVSVEFAELAYGVIIGAGEVDDSATVQRRHLLNKRRARGQWQVPVACPPNWIV